jgi:hypothetical protein
VPIPVTARSKAWLWSRSLAGIAGSNPAWRMYVCLLWMFCVIKYIKYTSPRQADPSSRGVLPRVAYAREALWRHRKIKRFPCNIQEATGVGGWGDLEVYLYIVWTSALQRGGWSTPRPGRFSPGKSYYAMKIHTFQKRHLRGWRIGSYTNTPQ